MDQIEFVLDLESFILDVLDDVDDRDIETTLISLFPDKPSLQLEYVANTGLTLSGLMSRCSPM